MRKIMRKIIIAILQRYDKELVVGLTQGDLCLCGYDYAEKLLANCEIQL